MSLIKMFRALNITQTINNISTRQFTYNRRVKFRLGINQAPKLYKPEEEDINNLPDPDKQVWREQRSLYKLELKGIFPKQKRANPLGDAPQMRGIVLKTVIKKPKKPNSANRKCVFIRLTNGRETTAHVPGIGHNLQEHSNVLVRLHRTKDVPGLRLKVIRGVYDCALVIKRKQQ